MHDHVIIIENYLSSFELFGHFLAFWGLIITFIVALFYAEHEKNGIPAFIWLVLLTVVLYNWSNVDLSNVFTARNLVIYLLAGLIYSVIRVIMFGRSRKNAFNKDADIFSEIEIQKYRKKGLDELKGNVSRWLFMWVISLTYQVVSFNIFNKIWTAIYSMFKSFFESLFDLGFGKIETNRKE